MKPRFSVLLEDPEALGPRATPVARVVATVLGEPVADAKLRVRYCGGIVVRAVPGAIARQLIRGLAALELGAFLVPEADLRQAPRPRRLATIAPGAEELTLGVRSRPARAHPWPAVRALYVHALTGAAGSGEREPLGWGAVGSGLTGDAQRLVDAVAELEQRERTRLQLGVDLLVDDNLYRFAHDEPGIYAGLPERGEHTLDNFLRLVRALVDAAPPEVLVPPATRRFAETGELQGVLRTKREELDAFASWSLTAAAQGVGFGAEEPEDLADEVLSDADEAIVVDAAADDDVDELEDEALEDDEDEEQGEEDDAELALASQAELDDEDEDDEPDVDLDDEDLDDASQADLDEEDEPDDEHDDDLDDDDELLERAPDPGEDDVDLDDPDLDDPDLAALEGAEDEPDDEEPPPDPEIAAVLEHFDQTVRFDKSTLAELLSDAEAIDVDDVEVTPDPDVSETAAFFDPSSGSWNVQRLLAESDALETEDL